MLPNAFVGKSNKPSESEIAAALGPSKALWDQLLSLLASETGDHEWNSYSIKAGWSLKLKHATRTILYLSPCRGAFRASFALREKAVKEALASDLSPRILKIIREAKRYREGTAVRIDVETTMELSDIQKLASLKVKN